MNKATIKHDAKKLKNQAEKKVHEIAKESPSLLHQGQEKIEDSVQSHPLLSLGFAAAVGYFLYFIAFKN